MLHLVLSKNWTVGRDEILRRISRDVTQRQGKRILLVPELISHEMERHLCAAAGDTASRYAEVLSFTRLARRVSEAQGTAMQVCLDAGGRVVAMAAAAQQLSSQLKAYAAVETKPEFLTGLIDAIDEFKRCCITSQDLKLAAQNTEGSLAQKLEELSLLMEGYDALCSRGKRDPRDQLTWLLEQLEDGFFAQDHVFYIDGFPDFTRQNLAILEHLIQQSPSVTVSLNCDQIDSALLAFEKAGDTAAQLYQCARRAGVEVDVQVLSDPPSAQRVLREKLFQGSITKGAAEGWLSVFRASSAYQECLAAAKQVINLVHCGSRYRDITLVCTDMSVYLPLVNLIFHRFHIPVYQSGTEVVLERNVIQTVLTALDAVLSGFDQRSTMRYLRSALSPLEPDICDRVENYAFLWGIRGQKWLTDWQFHPEGLSGEWNPQSEQALAEINAARNLAIAPLAALQKGFRDAQNVQQQVTALYAFLEDIQLQQRLCLLAERLDASGDNRSAQILNQLWEILLSALEQLYDVLGQTHWEAEHFGRLLRLLLSQYDVGTIPPVLDAVQMGQVSAMRCRQEKHLIVLGASEGQLPGYTGSTGVLTDQERVVLRELGVPLTGGAMEGIQAEFAEIYGVFSGAMETVSVYYSGEQPSFVCRRLAELAGKEKDLEEDMTFAQADAVEAAAYLARWNAGDAAEDLGLKDIFEEICSHRDYTLGKVAKKNIEKLYGSTLNLSASQIDRQAECRLSYFLKYGLRAKERKEVTVDPAEFGTYVHAVLENTARCIREMGGFSKVSLEETLEIAHQYSEEYARQRFSQIDSERMNYLFRRNIRELDMVVQELWEELKDSLFEPEGFEVNFGGPDGLPPIPIPNSQMKALLRGFVDRVDVWRNGYTNYYRVVDYKTGRKSFDYCDVFNGVGLQMLLYMFVLRENGGELLGSPAVAAGVQYFPARVPYLSADARMEEESIRQARQKEWKRSGLLLRDEAVLQAMEPGQQPQRMRYTVNKDGSLAGDLADREQMKLLEGYVFHYLARMVEDIASGNVEPNPYTRGSSHNACAYCPYGSICHEKNVEGRRNYRAMDAAKFWEEVGKEMGKIGR